MGVFRSAAFAVPLLLAACAAGGPNHRADLYAGLADADVAQASRTLQVALETLPQGVGLDWSNAATGAAGRVTPRATLIRPDGVFCRRYEERLTVAGREGRFEQMACRDREGRWVWVE